MRFVACATALLAALALAGCGSDVAVELVWGGPPAPGPGGVVSVDGFASYQREVDEHWEGSPTMAAGEFLRLDERTAARTTIETKASAEGTGPQTVVVMLDGLLDDSICAERWRLGFEEGSGRLHADRGPTRAALPTRPRTPGVLSGRLRLTLATAVRCASGRR